MDTSPCGAIGTHSARKTSRGTESSIHRVSARASDASVTVCRRPPVVRPLSPHPFLLALALATALFGAAALTPERAEGARKLFVSAGGSDAGRCTARKPCRTFARAYRAAQLGDTVVVRGGSYPAQLLPGEGAKAPKKALAKDVVFRPARGAKVRVAELEVRVPHVQFHRMYIRKWKAAYDTRSPDRYAAGDLTFRQIRTHHFSLRSVHHARIIGGEVGPNSGAPSDSGRWPQDGGFIGAWPVDVHPPKDILIKGVNIHDVREPNEEAHSDCIQFTAGVNIRILGNRFRNCEHADLMIKGDQGPIRNFRIENNYLGRTLSAHYSINLYETDRGCEKVLMRNNTALQNIRLDACSGGTMTGTIQPSMSEHTCSSAEVRLSWNVYESGVRCESTSIVRSVRFRDRGRFDLRLARRSAAIGRGNPNNFAPVDIKGTRRPKGKRPDAGAHERR